MIMNNNQTVQQLKPLKLHGMASSYQAQLEIPLASANGSFHELIAHLAQSNYLHVPTTKEQLITF